MASRIQLDFSVSSDLAIHNRPRNAASPQLTSQGYLGWIRNVAARWHQRRVLAQLDDRALRDIGVSRSQALAEALKPCWRR